MRSLERSTSDLLRNKVFICGSDNLFRNKTIRLFMNTDSSNQKVLIGYENILLNFSNVLDGLGQRLI